MRAALARVGGGICASNAGDTGGAIDSLSSPSAALVLYSLGHLLGASFGQIAGAEEVDVGKIVRFAFKGAAVLQVGDM